MRKTITDLEKLKGQRPIVMITAYDATMARLVDSAVDAILVGDSLGMVVQGHDSTLPVTLDEMVYHTRMAARGSHQAFLIGDLPFMSYQASPADALNAAGRLMKEAGAQAVKLEGGKAVCPQVSALSAAGIPVVGHLGLTPQSIHAFGGFGKQGKEDSGARLMLEDAQALEAAGARMLVLENIPHDLGKSLSEALRIPTIGIGAGPHCDGQVQVMHDLLGLIPDFTPRHAKQYINGAQVFQEAVGKYAEDVRQGLLISR